MESFYCKAYSIHESEQKRYRGRGQPYQLKQHIQKERGLRRPRYATYTANWWARAESTLTALHRLRKKGVGHDEVHALEACCRHLALDGVPSAGAEASSTARLHRTLWRDRLINIQG
eukprot:9062555-Pyramimonas_sp.AAC.1